MQLFIQMYEVFVDVLVKTKQYVTQYHTMPPSNHVYGYRSLQSVGILNNPIYVQYHTLLHCLF